VLSGRLGVFVPHFAKNSSGTSKRDYAMR
jgi:hypothetical protein